MSVLLSGEAFAASSTPIDESAKTETYDLSQFALVQDYRFGNGRGDATIRNKADLDQVATYWYIYGGYGSTSPINGGIGPSGDGTDGLYGQEYSRKRNAPEGDPLSLHVFTANSLKFKARNTPTALVPGSALREVCSPARSGTNGFVQSGIARFFAPIVPNQTFIRIRAKMPPADWAWPTLWLNPGTEAFAPLGGPRGAVGALLWPPEIDIQDGFGYYRNGKAKPKQGTLLRIGEPTAGKDDVFGRARIWEKADWTQNPGWDYEPGSVASGSFVPSVPEGWMTQRFHEFAVLWLNDTVSYFNDGVMFAQSTLRWDAGGNADNPVPAHLIVGMEIAPRFNGPPAQLTDPGGDNWTLEISDIQVYRVARGQKPTVPNPGNLSPPPGQRTDNVHWTWPIPSGWAPKAVINSTPSLPSNLPRGQINPSAS